LSVWERLVGDRYCREKRRRDGQVKEISIGCVTAVFRKMKGYRPRALLALYNDLPENWDPELRALGDDDLVVELAAITPFGHIDPEGADTEVKRNESKLYTTADFLRLFAFIVAFAGNGS
jgi:hypothetical protein